MATRPHEDHEELQRRLTAALTLPHDSRHENANINPQGFTVFDEAQLTHALSMTSEFFTIAKNTPARPIGAVLDAVEAKLRDNVNDNDAVRHALMVFLTHNPIAQKENLKIVSLAQRAPDLAIPVHSTQLAPDEQDTEVELNYWREDINLNEHHEHWHIVYPGGGIPDPRNPSKLRSKDRQGELFIYMHQQMIARYNAERLVNGFPPVVSIKDYHAPLEADVPDRNLRWRGKMFTARKAGVVMTDLGHKGQGDYMPLSTLEQARDRILEAIKAGKFKDGTPITADNLGGTLEANAGSVDRKYYGGLHNTGHVLIAYLGNPSGWQDRNVVPGLMYETRTAVRDPVFWRWHAHIDDLFTLWQDQQPPQKFNDAPPITFRKTGAPTGSPDIITVYTDVLAAAGVNLNDDQAVEAWGEKTFGGAKWDAAPATQFSTDTWETEFRTRSFTNVGDDNTTETITYLYPREFVYFFKVSNPTPQPRDVTLRVFAVPTQTANDRRAWIEMDKFKATVPANSKKVVFRRADQSSVIRKPAQKTVEQMDDRRDEDDGLDRTGDQYCDCGWPFNMLVPKGSPNGTSFTLAVLATDWTLDQVPSEKGCGSMSFCGAKEKYPDAREMGYPFNRKFEKPILDTIAAVPTFAAKQITIRFQPKGFSKLARSVVDTSFAKPVTAPVIPATSGLTAASAWSSFHSSSSSSSTTTTTTSATTATATSAKTTVTHEAVEPVTPGKSVSTQVAENGDVITTTVEVLPDGTKKTTRHIQRQVAKGTPAPWNITPGTFTRTETDEQGRKWEVTETVGGDGVRKVTKKLLHQ